MSSEKDNKMTINEKLDDIVRMVGNIAKERDTLKQSLEEAYRTIQELKAQVAALTSDHDVDASTYAVEPLVLTEEDKGVFLDALFKNPPKPNPALLKAFERRKALLQKGEFIVYSVPEYLGRYGDFEALMEYTDTLVDKIHQLTQENIKAKSEGNFDSEGYLKWKELTHKIESMKPILNLDMDVLRDSYDFTLSTEGEVCGLIAGDQCFVPTGIKLNVDDVAIWVAGLKAVGLING